MRILLVGALAWNPERMLSLCDRGHELYGLWTRSMSWEQGPYPFAQNRIRAVRLTEAAEMVERGHVDVVYSLFMAYPASLWDRERGRDLPELWGALRHLLRSRQRSRPGVPIIRHWGSDTATFDPEVVFALDGHLFCNPELHHFLTAPLRQGGLGMALACPADRIAYLDSDLPMRAFMNDRYAPKLSEKDGEIHTVCVGRPTGIDLIELSRQRIHLHVYGNSFDSVARTLAESVRIRDLRRTCRAAERFVHVHPSRQIIAGALDEIRAVKSTWVSEFSRYDAGWSYVNVRDRGALADRALIPNRLGTYLLAGLPIITERLPGYYRYEVPHQRGIDIEFRPGDYAELAAKLRDRGRLRAVTARARSERASYSFEATLDPLIAFLERITAWRAAEQRSGAGRSVARLRPWPTRAAWAARHCVSAWTALRRRARRRAASLKAGYLTASLRPPGDRGVPRPSTAA
jgi:hypothetical protein